MSSPATSPFLSPRWPLAAAIGISLLAIALRLFPIHESLWIDELHTAWCAVGSLDEVLPRATIGNQSPLFFWLQWLLVRLLGPNEWSLRLPSFMAGALLPLAAFLLVRRWSTSCAGLVASALTTIDPTSIFYATEARPYALVQLLALIHAGLTAELILRPSAWLRAAWVAIAAVLFNLHYTAALIVPAEIVFYALASIVWPRLVNHRWTSCLLDGFILVLFCLPAVGNIASIFDRRTNWAAFIPLESLDALFDWWPPAVGVGFIAAAALTDRSPARRAPADTPGDPNNTAFLALVSCWLLVPTLCAWMATRFDVARLFFPRYLMVAQPAALAAAALCPDLAPWRRSKIALSLLIVSAALATGGVADRLIHEGRVSAPRGEDWRGAVGWLNEQPEKTQFPVLVYSGLIEANALREPHDPLLEDYCLLPVASLYPLDLEPADMIPLPVHEPGRLDQTAELLVVHRGGAWLIVRGGREAGQKIATEIIKIGRAHV